MRAAFVAVGMMALAVIGNARDLACAAPFMTQSWELLKQARYGRTDYERAAFLTVDASGNDHFVPWPYHRESLHATYAGTIPQHVAAIVHTHPNEMPFPSDHDAEVARRTGFAVYVVTRLMITRTDGRAVAVVWRGDWNPGRHPDLSRCQGR